MKLNTDDPAYYGWGDASPMDNHQEVKQLIRTLVEDYLVGEDPLVMLRESLPAAREDACRVLGEAALESLESRLALLAIDECWSDHLAAVAEIREGIHLAEVGGLWPLAEFHKQAAESFDLALQSVDARMVERFASLDITSEGIRMDQMGLLGPSSTWTYLVDDHASTDRLAASLLGRRNIGFAVGAALTGPLFMLWVLSRHLLRRGRR